VFRVKIPPGERQDSASLGLGVLKGRTRFTGEDIGKKLKEMEEVAGNQLHQILKRGRQNFLKCEGSRAVRQNG